MTYNLVGSAAWAGGTILFDDYGTVPIESADLSGRSSLVFKVNGAPKKVKFEIEDASGVKIDSILQNTSSALTQYFTITSGEITSAGVDMAHIRDINFIVITNLTGSAARQGTFQVNTGGLLSFNYIITSNTFFKVPTTFPNNPKLGLVGGSESQSTYTQTSPSVARLTYNISSGEWAGLSYVYDDYNTVPIESQDLTSYSSFVFGFRGNPKRIELQFYDASEKSHSNSNQ